MRIDLKINFCTNFNMSRIKINRESDDKVVKVGNSGLIKGIEIKNEEDEPKLNVIKQPDLSDDESAKIDLISSDSEPRYEPIEKEDESKGNVGFSLFMNKNKQKPEPKKELEEIINSHEPTLEEEEKAKSEKSVSDIGNNSEPGFFSKNYSDNESFGYRSEPRSETRFEPRFETSKYDSDSDNDEDTQKAEYLRKFERIKKKGVKVHKEFTMNSSLSEMKKHYTYLEKSRETDNSINFARKLLLGCIYGIEFLNNRYDPFDVDLDGWTENMMQNITDHDDIFERLHEKYKDKAKIAPELELLFAVGGSAAMFHMSKRYMNPLMGNMMRQNPNMINNLMNVARNASEGMPIPNMRSASQQDPRPTPPVPQQQFTDGYGRTVMPNRTQGPPPRREMRGPSNNLEDIIKTMQERRGPGSSSSRSSSSSRKSSKSKTDVKTVSVNRGKSKTGSRGINLNI